MHVNDLSSAHILALEKMERTGESDDFNLGSGEGFTVKEVIESAKRITGRDFKVETAPRRAGDPAVLVADSAKARRVLGWETLYNLDKEQTYREGRRNLGAQQHIGVAQFAG